MSKDWLKTWTPGEHSTYRRLSKDVEAFRFGHELPPPWFEAAVQAGTVTVANGNRLSIKNKTSTINAWTGDWILSQGKDDIYPCHHDLFIDTYAPTPKYEKTKVA